jgi:hypothetical protein
MTIYELFLNIKIGADKLDSNAYPELKPEILDRLTNQALDIFVKRIVNNFQNKGGIEENQKKTDDIYDLIKYTKIEPVEESIWKTDTIKTLKFRIPEDYWYSVAESVIVSILPCPSGIRVKDCYGTKIKELPRVDKQVPVKSEVHNRIPTKLVNPHYQPTINNLYRVMSNADGINKQGDFILFFDKDIIPKEYILVYIRRIPEIFVNTTYSINPDSPIYYQNIQYPMNEQCQREIIDIAIGLCVEGIESDRIKTLTQFRT